ncbi:MAG: hypothetical protein HY959_05065 [Ignavibacteriae bacterium]|nr:hypothetical protein [Ignavibacteriota bacterium]
MGPSKEELEKYFKSNRKYFDELARNYKISDPDYYNKFIAPFYGYQNQGTSHINAPKRRIVLTAGLALLVGIGAFMMIFFIKQKEEVAPVITSEKIEKLTEELSAGIDTMKGKSSEMEKKSDTLDRIKKNYNFNHGKFLFKLRKMDEAEEFLKKVPKNHPDYEQVEYMLKEIKKERKSKK